MTIKLVVGWALFASALATAGYKGMQKVEYNAALSKGASAYEVNYLGFGTETSSNVLDKVTSEDEIGLGTIVANVVGVISSPLDKQKAAYISCLSEGEDLYKASNFASTWVKEHPGDSLNNFHEALEKATGKEYHMVVATSILGVHEGFEKLGTDKFMDQVRLEVGQDLYQK